MTLLPSFHRYLLSVYLSSLLFPSHFVPLHFLFRLSLSLLLLVSLVSLFILPFIYFLSNGIKYIMFFLYILRKVFFYSPEHKLKINIKLSKTRSNVIVSPLRCTRKPLFWAPHYFVNMPRANNILASC
uniref:Uncharacterized protein n=1 Tax=Cacopsylla melanoneura TaxID=428564 RepID=A0A8D9AWQ0_9HEMI